MQNKKYLEKTDIKPDFLNGRLIHLRDQMAKNIEDKTETVLSLCFKHFKTFPLSLCYWTKEM